MVWRCPHLDGGAGGGGGGAQPTRAARAVHGHDITRVRWLWTRSAWMRGNDRRPLRLQFGGMATAGLPSWQHQGSATHHHRGGAPNSGTTDKAGKF